jgi:colicin import membrane protein
LRINSSEPGLIVSGAVHVAVLLLTLVAFAGSRKFEDAQEAVPVEMITDQQFNQIMKGEKTAKEVKQTPIKADKVAEIEEKKPTPQREAKVDIPTPPPPLKRIPDPGPDDTPAPPTPPKRVAAIQPPTPPMPPKVEPKPEPPPKPEAEAIDPPKPPPRPPQPPKVRPAPKEEAKTKPEEKPLDKVALAKLLDDKKATDAQKPASRPKSGEETTEPKHRLDTAALSKLLSSEPAGQRPSTARSTNQTASIGSPTASAPKMSPSMWGQLDALLQDQFKQCWTYLGLGGESRYIPQIKVEYAQTGALVGQPALLNPPSDPNMRNLADSAIRAVRRCNPLKIPPQFMPYYDQWKARILRFDPQEMAG